MAGVRQHFPCGRIADDHHFIAANRIEQELFRIDGEAAGAVARSDGIALGNQRVLGVDFDDFVLVFDVDVDVALAVDLRELGLTADGDGAVMTAPVLASMAVESLLRPLKVKTRWVTGS